MTSQKKSITRTLREGHRISHWNDDSTAPLAFLPYPATAKAQDEDDPRYDKRMLVLPWNRFIAFRKTLIPLKQITRLRFKDLSGIMLLDKSVKPVSIQKGGRMVIPRDIIGEIKEGTRLKIKKHGDGTAVISLPRDGIIPETRPGTGAEDTSETDFVKQLDISLIDASKHPDKRTRKIVTDEFIADIEKRGLREPILAVGDTPPYRLISGFKRYEAKKRLIKKGKNRKIKAIIIPECSPAVIASIQAAMNYHPPVANELPNAIDLINRALQYRGQDLKVPEIAAKMKIHPRTVRDYLEIAQADKRILKALAAEKITHYQALELKRGKMLPEQFPKGKVPSVRELRELRRARAEAASKELAR